MTVMKFAKESGCSILSGTDSLQNDISGGYCGDLLSWVMGRAKSGDAWITIMGNQNAVAVAVLAGVSCILLAEGAALDNEAMKKAAENDVAVLSSDQPAFELASALSKLIKE